MTDREKLHKLLDESFLEQYNTRLFLTAKHTANFLISHGVTVKEMQKPLTVDEASGTNEPVWMEYITGMVFVCDLVVSPGWNGIYDAYIIGTTEPKPLPEMYYGKTWRCWADKPTEEERKAAEWLT